jgi:PAS domain S-box-containing protein
MMEAGHVLIGAAGELLRMDAAFCGIMRLSEEEMRGRLVLDVTAPPDRAKCAAAIQRLRDTGQPFEITKRVIRDDGSLLWVKNSVSITIGDDGPGMIMATIEPIVPCEDHGPARLLDAARGHIAVRKDRASVCDPAFLADAGWDAILAIYIAEAEGRSVDVARLAELIGHTPGHMERWVKAMLDQQVIEIEYAHPHAETAKSYRLTAGTHRKLEEFLARDRRAPSPLPFSGGVWGERPE